MRSLVFQYPRLGSGKACNLESPEQTTTKQKTNKTKEKLFLSGPKTRKGKKPLTTPTLTQPEVSAETGAGTVDYGSRPIAWGGWGQGGQEGAPLSSPSENTSSRRWEREQHQAAWGSTLLPCCWRRSRASREPQLHQAAPGEPRSATPHPPPRAPTSGTSGNPPKSPHCRALSLAAAGSRGEHFQPLRAWHRPVPHLVIS